MKEQALAKLAEEFGKGKYNSAANLMKKAVREALETFVRQDEEFAQAVVQGGTFEECMEAVSKNVGRGISDLDVYKRAVQFYFPGANVILFLRRDNDPAAPYVTIEASAENNCAKVILRQVHGYRNDIGAESPSLTHKAFLEKWLAWVHSGSPRDSAGRPVTA